MDTSGAISGAIEGALSEQDGGRIIDQGTYGCIFDPPLLCADARRQRELEAKRKRGIIGKVSKRDDAAAEKRSGVLLAKIPNYKDYFVFADPTSFCKMAAVEQQAEENIYRCGVVNKYGSRQMWVFTMPWGGMNIKSLYSTATKRPQAIPVEKIVERVLEIGATMVLYGFIHFDFHSNNILFDEKTFMPRIIDFAFLFHANEISKETFDTRWREYSPRHPPEPPELTMFTGHKGGIPYSQIIYDMIRQKDSLKKAETRLGLSRVAQARELSAFWGASEAAKSGDPVRFFKTYWPALDAFSIGEFLMEFLSRLQAEGGVAISAATQRRIKLVARGLLRMSPLARLDCVEALALWNPDNTILQSPKAEVWLAARQRDRAAIKAEA